MKLKVAVFLPLFAFLLLFWMGIPTSVSNSYCIVRDVDTTYKVMFYNVENLFDTSDDKHTLDNEFLPDGNHHWTYQRFRDKINKIYKVIIALGAGDPPAIIGFCEVENRYVLEQLVNETPLLHYGYKIIHSNSPDIRGIDVAMIYRPEKFRPVLYRYLKVKNEKDSAFKTRDILYVKGLTHLGDTLHLYFNHWPSRRGGQKASEQKRTIAAHALRNSVDSLFNISPKAKVIITGDFNDDPIDKSITTELNAQLQKKQVTSNTFFNMSYEICSKIQTGTLKFNGQWNCFDQFIVSSALLFPEKGYYVTNDSYTIFSPDFLLEDDEKYSGKKPFRTYIGLKYQNGFSDHLPVYLRLKLMTKNGV